MARPEPHQNWHDQDTDPQKAEWRALRDDLIALLGQVENQYARTDTAHAARQAVADRAYDLKSSPGAEPHMPERHQAALRSVQRAVERFAERDAPPRSEAPNPQDMLQSAIQQIREKQNMTASRPAASAAPSAAGAAGQHPAEQPPAGQNQIARLTEAVMGITERLAVLEKELKASHQSAADVKEIAQQVSQLTHVVELLAGAVGETGQVKRLEAQIANIARMVSEGPRGDVSALTQRLDDLARTVDRLAEMHVEQAGRDDSAFESLGENQRESMLVIEQSVRSIYDRLDHLEKNYALNPADIERLSHEMAAFTEALRSGEAGGAPDGLLQRLDALDARIAMIEESGAANVINGLKGELGALRDAVIGAVEPRFAAIESRIDALSSSVADRGGEISVGQLEAQIRQLVARMDQTGEQLSDIARLQAESEQQRSGPDLEAMAEIVARRTSEEVVRSRADDTPGFADKSIDELEARLSRLFTSTAPTDDFSDVRDSISHVGERLDRLETALTALNASGEARAPVAEPLGQMDKPGAARRAKAPVSITRHEAEPRESAPGESQPEEFSGARALSSETAFYDKMPSDPSIDSPLVDQGFGHPEPLLDHDWSRDALVVPRPASRKSEPTAAPKALAEPRLDTPAEEGGRSPLSPFDPERVERPAKPKSQFDQEALAPRTAPMPRKEPTLSPRHPAQEPPATPTSRSTFIEAARRAAQKHNAPPLAAAQSGSVIARAISRFQIGKAKPEAGDVLPAPVQEKPEKPARGKPARPETDKSEPAKPKKARRGRDEAPHAEPTVDSSKVQEPDALADETASESFLTRHRRPILLAATLAAVVALALNLVGQRLADGNGEETPPAASTATEEPAPAGDAPASGGDDAPAFLPQPMLDPAPTGSIDPFARVAPSGVRVVTQSIPSSIGDAVAEPGVDTQPTGSIGPAETPEPDGSPVEVELPPEAIGPLALREAAANGDPRAQFEVGAILAEGRVVQQDFEGAAKWYERAAAQGFAPAEYRLGSFYENGSGVDKDLTQARLWYQRAAEAGNRLAMHNLAALYAGGELGKQEFAPAAEWFERAAERGMTDSQFNLGMLYARGLGVPQDLEASYKWFGLAAASGDEDAEKARDDVARSLDAAAVSRLQDEIAAWTRKPVDIGANYAPIGTWAEDFDPGETIRNTEVVRNVQKALQRLGYDVGTSDGIFGPKTQEAIKAFERATGMSEVGQVNPRLLAVLGSQPA